MKLAIFFVVSVWLASCSDRHCTEIGCWANRQDIVDAAERCGVAEFEPQVVGDNAMPWVPGEDRDTGVRTTCIIRDLQRQDLQVTH